MADTELEALRVISISACEEVQTNALEVAMRVDAKRFLSHRSCEQLIDLMWRGGDDDARLLEDL